jgi:NitT/TauT family transport system substrate-binding protein
MKVCQSGRGKIAASLLAAMGMIATTALFSNEAAAQASAPLKKVRIAVATTVLGVSYPWLNMPLALGYWKDEGYDVEVMPVGASLQVVQQMVGRNAELGEVNSSVVVQANVVNNIPVRVVMMNGVIDTAISVPKDSAIREVKDLKGKTIGVFSLASGAIPLLKSYLRANGLDPDKDVSLIPVGLGAPVVDALRTNKVQALVYWGSANANLENAGLELRYLADPEWKRIPDFSLVALQPTIAANADMIVAIARGAAKASVFAMANPDCVRKLQWAHFPKTKPTGADEATLARWDLRSLNAQLETMKQAYELAGQVWSAGSAADYARMQDFMVETKQIEKKVDPAAFINDIPDFAKKVNDFNHEAIIQQAKACSMS